MKYSEPQLEELANRYVAAREALDDLSHRCIATSDGIDAGASDGESGAWWAAVADELRRVIAAPDARAASEIIAWWHHDWSAVSETPQRAATRIRRAA